MRFNDWTCKKVDENGSPTDSGYTGEGVAKIIAALFIGTAVAAFLQGLNF